MEKEQVVNSGKWRMVGIFIRTLSVYYIHLVSDYLQNEATLFVARPLPPFFWSTPRNQDSSIEGIVVLCVYSCLNRSNMNLFDCTIRRLCLLSAARSLLRNTKAGSRYI